MFFLGRPLFTLERSLPLEVRRLLPLRTSLLHPLRLFPKAFQRGLPQLPPSFQDALPGVFSALNDLMNQTASLDGFFTEPF